MPIVQRSFTVDPTPSVVLDYLKDFSNAPEWDPGTESCTRTDQGPIAVGASWCNVSKVAGRTTELTYRLAEISPDHLVFRGENKSATSTDTITVRPDGGGSEVTYHADIQMHGLAKLASPAVKVLFERIANDTENQMTAVLNALVA
jgi:carbon monoxide dehydrogenase subunit G